MKKATGKGKGTAKKSAKQKARTKKGKDIVQVRSNINDLVRDSAEDIATEVIKVAKTGQLASAKYLFEATGLYPATEQTSARPIETTLAHTLLTRMGLPLEPVVCDEEPPVIGFSSGAKAESAAIATPSVEEEDPDAEDPAAIPGDGEE